MIIIHLNPAGVEKVYFQSDSYLAEDLCMAAWPLVRRELDRLDSKLRRAASSAARNLKAEGGFVKRPMVEDGICRRRRERRGSTGDYSIYRGRKPLHPQRGESAT